MKCPACFHALTPARVGAVSVDVCQGGCGGIWLDAFELQKVDQEGDTAVEDLLLRIMRDASVHVDAHRKRDCPRCDGVRLKRRFFSPNRLVEVDECPGCGGFWLDHGELEKVREEMEETRVSRRAQAEAPELTSRMIRYLYQRQLEESGDEF